VANFVFGVGKSRGYLKTGGANPNIRLSHISPFLKPPLLI